MRLVSCSALTGLGRLAVGLLGKLPVRRLAWRAAYRPTLGQAAMRSKSVSKLQMPSS